MYCNQCHRTIPDGSRYCSFCGAEQEQKTSVKPWLIFLLILVVILAAVLWGFPALMKYVILNSAGEYFLSENIPLIASEEPRSLGDGGYCSVWETMEPIMDCTQVTLTLEAEGLYGATTRGNWEVHFRIGGQWNKIQTIYYGGVGLENFTIHFDPAASFDAVCAFPTQRGNYSYQSSMALSDAYCD